MKELVKRYAERIDAATLRERVLVFLALTAALVFLANAVLLEPLRARQKSLRSEIAAQQKELQTVQEQLGRMAQSAAQDLDAPNRARLAALREQMKELAARLTQEQRRFTPPERMRAVLQEILQRNRRLALLDLKTLPVTQLGESAPSGQDAGAQASANLYRHGIELTVSGRYGDLYEYLLALEGLQTQVYWRRAELSALDYPVLTLRLTAYTVSFDPAWLIV